MVNCQLPFALAVEPVCSCLARSILSDNGVSSSSCPASSTANVGIVLPPAPLHQCHDHPQRPPLSLSPAPSLVKASARSPLRTILRLNDRTMSSTEPQDTIGYGHAISLPSWHRNSKQYRKAVSTPGPPVRNFSYPSSLVGPVRNQAPDLSVSPHIASRSADFA